MHDKEELNIVECEKCTLKNFKVIDNCFFPMEDGFHNLLLVKCFECGELMVHDLGKVIELRY